MLVGLLTVGARAQQPTTLPPGIQGTTALDGSQRDALKNYIEGNYRVIKTGTITQQRAARDALRDMFNAPSVSTSFRQAASESLAPLLEEAMGSTSRWDRFSALVLAAKLATEDSARIFTEALDPNGAAADGDLLIALGQLRVMFLEVDVGGLALSTSTLNRLVSLLERGLTETDDPSVAQFQARALRALSQSTRTDATFVGVRGTAIAALSNAIASRLNRGGLDPIGASPKDLDELLVALEALDGARGFLVVRSTSTPLAAEVAKALGQLSGQSLAFVTRTYERTPADADTARRYLERMAQLGTDVATILFSDHDLHQPNNVVTPAGMLKADQLVAHLAANRLQQFKLEVIKIIGSLGRAYGLADGWAPID